MQKILGVEILDTRDHLIRKHEDSLQAELAATGGRTETKLSNTAGQHTRN